MRTKSIVVFKDSTGEHISKCITNTITELKNNMNVLTYSYTDTQIAGSKNIYDDKLEYLSKAKDYRIYAKALDYCEKHKIDILFIPRLLYPEYLLSELSVRPKLMTKIVFGIFGLKEAFMSNARANVLLDLLKNEHIHKTIIYSIAGDSPLAIPENIKKMSAFNLRKIKSKINFVYEPIAEKASQYNFDREKARKQFGFKKDQFVVLYFGAMFYGKGIDILEKSTKYLGKDVKYLVASDPNTINFDFDPNKLNNNEHILFIDKFIPNPEMPALFAAVDAVVLPYRRTYEYDSSAVFVQSVLANKLIITPDFVPFKIPINQYKLGNTYMPEDPKSLAKAILKLKNDQSSIKSSARFTDYLQNIQSWKEFADLVSSK